MKIPSLGLINAASTGIAFVKMDATASTYEEAENICAGIGGQLAFFKNEAEYNEFSRELPTEREWLGIQRAGDGWVNSDGSKPFLKWLEGEPKYHYCAEMYPGNPPKINEKRCEETAKRAVRCRIKTNDDLDERTRKQKL